MGSCTSTESGKNSKGGVYDSQGLARTYATLTDFKVYQAIGEGAMGRVDLVKLRQTSHIYSLYINSPLATQGQKESLARQASSSTNHLDQLTNLDGDKDRDTTHQQTNSFHHGRNSELDTRDDCVDVQYASGPNQPSLCDQTLESRRSKTKSSGNNQNTSKTSHQSPPTQPASVRSKTFPFTLGDNDKTEKPSDRILFALKRVKKEHVTRDQAHLTAAWRERDVLVALALHSPCLFTCQMKWAFQSPSEVFFVSEFLAGGN